MIASQYGTVTDGWPLSAQNTIFGSPVMQDEEQASRRHLQRRKDSLYGQSDLLNAFLQNVQPSTKDAPPMSQRRIVQVFIADADQNVPLASALLHKTEPAFTDSTDQELYFELPVAELLKAHNEKRKTWMDKDASRKSGKDVLLEPIKIRDLKMVVVTIAQF